MNLYDEVISDWNALLSASAAKKLSACNADWPDAGNANMVFQKDAAFSLGGGRLFQQSAFAVTEDPLLVSEDEILLIGPDIDAIREDMPFCRLTAVRTKKGALTEGDALLSQVQKINFVKYHVSPEGYMLRISSGNSVESVRVSKTAVKKGLNFETVGNMYRKVFHENKNVEAVKIIFITDTAFDYETLKGKIKKAADITKAIDHIRERASLMDCGVCSLQEVCDEVEGLRQLHFSRQTSESEKA